MMMSSIKGESEGGVVLNDKEFEVEVSIVVV